MPDLIRTIGASLTTFALVIGLWSAAIDLFALPAYVLPGPRAVAAALARGWIDGGLWDHAAFTLSATLTGFALGCLAGAMVGALVSESRVMSLAIYPVIIAIQSMPTVAIAPLIIVYLGTGMESKVFTVALLCFFPVFVNMVAGLAGADPRLIDLYRAYAASRWRLFWDVKLPGALDHLLASLQIAMVLAFVGCVVSEFIASTKGLGYVIRLFGNDLNVAMMFAAIASLGVLGGGLGLALLQLHRRVVFWRRR
jgi:NitT/TauT family transport system permease protein